MHLTNVHSWNILPSPPENSYVKTSDFHFRLNIMCVESLPLNFFLIKFEE